MLLAHTAQKRHRGIRLSKMRLRINFMCFSVATILQLIQLCLSEFHPIYQAMIGDPTLRAHSLTYASSANQTSGKKNLTSLFVYPNLPGPFNAVIIAPDADGRNSFEDGRAVALARQGYVALSADMRISNEISGDDSALDTRAVLLDQYLLAYHEIKRLPFITKVASIGYGLGGLTMLDAIRLKVANITAAICMHAILRPLNRTSLAVRTPQFNSTPKLLILDGWRDPLNPKEIVDDVLQELDRLNIDWQLHRFSQAKHGFTTPSADFENITQFNAEANNHAWVETLMFLDFHVRQ